MCSKNNNEYSLVDTPDDFSSQGTADASPENSKGDRNGGHSGSRGSNPSSYLSCTEDLDNQRLGIKLSLPSQVTSKSFSPTDSPYLVNTSSTFNSRPSYKGNHLLNPHLVVGNASPAIAHSSISGTVQDVGLSVWPPKMAVAPTSKKCLWQSQGPLASSCSLPSLVRQISGSEYVRQLQSETSMQVACKPLSAVQLWASDDRVRLRPEKRKGAALDLLPWHIEVARGPCKLQTISCLAESEWVLASNRLSENTEINHGVVPESQATKRLRLTTQLLQQLIRPAPVSILSTDARLNGESVVFSVCRLALGDACSLIRDSHLDPLASDKPLEKKFGTSDSIGKQDFLITLESFNQRAKRLESDLLRLVNLSSIVETKVEIQELEKFSVTSRFAKFHIRGNIVSGDDASSDSGATRKPRPQRYVVAHPMPKILPEDAKCLSL